MIMKKSSRVYWIDILRAIALLYMVIYYIFVITGIRFQAETINNIISFGGEIGVSIFFVISGYSIYKSLDKQKDFHYGTYIKKRLKRIGPHYYISIIIALLFTSAVVYLNKKHLLNILTHFFFLHNLFFEYHGAISGVLWTMGVIFQFYLIAPLLKKWIDKHPLITVLFSLIFSCIIKTFLYKYFYVKELDYWYYFIYGRQLFNTLDAFVLGMFVSKYAENKLSRLNKIGLLISLIFLIFMILLGSNSLVIFNTSSIYSFSIKGILYFYIIDIIIAIIIYFLSKLKYKENKIKKVFLFISKYEYAIYIWHLLILNSLMNNVSFATNILKYNPLIIMIVLLIVLVLLGMLFDKIISNINFGPIFNDIKQIWKKIRGVNMKKYFKEIWPAYILSLVLSYMLFFYEPIIFYSNNIEDLWFDLGILLNNTLILFFISCVGIIVLLSIIYFINKKFFKWIYLVFFIGFIYVYIQGNFLVGSLPVLDGTPIDWNLYNTQNILSLVLFLMVCVIAIISFIKKPNFIKYTAFISIAIAIMLTTSLITTTFATGSLKNKEIIVSTTFNNMNTYSKEKNFIILLLDAIDSRYFAKALEENKEFNHIFDDFTYYPDTLSGHPFTTESIPYILTGERYEHQEELNKWETEAMKNSFLLNNLYENGYELNLFDRDIIYNDKTALRISNAVEMNSKNIVNKKVFIKEELKYILFRYLPYPLKKYSKIEGMSLGLDKVSKSSDIEYFYENNFEFINRTASEKFELKENKQFKYFHLDGAHIPFTFNKELKDIETADYYSEVEGMCTLVKNYLNMLKEKDVYDNSAIIIISDHGYNVDASIYGRQNPILYVKGINEKHNNMVTSDKPISFADLNSAYADLINDKKSIELFNNIEKNRVRKFLLYPNDTKKMVEYETTAKAWETEKMYKTGKEFNPISKQ